MLYWYIDSERIKLIIYLIILENIWQWFNIIIAIQ